MMRRFEGVLAVLFVIGAYALAAHFDAQPDRRTDWSEAQAIEAQQRAAAAHERRDFAAQQACGPDAAAFEWVSDTAVQCFSKKGSKTERLQVSIN